MRYGDEDVPVAAFFDASACSPRRDALVHGWCGRRPAPADGRVLMVDQRHTGGWALPGGLLRRGEAPADGLARKVAEEVGVHLDGDELPVPLALVDVEARRVGWLPLDDLPDVTEPTQDILQVVRRA